ncbi:MAG: methylmalonyl-CoA mutase, partial [Myxococcales bacterium]
PAARRGRRREPFRVCPRQAPGVALASLLAEVDEGADALWLSLDDTTDGQLAAPSLAHTVLVLDTADPQPVARLARALGLAASAPAASGPTAPAASTPRFALTLDPLARCAGGRLAPGALADAIAALGPVARDMAARLPGSSAVMVSTLPYHQAGADAVDELALALSAGAAYLEALLAAGLAPAVAASQIALQVTAGRDTFVELSKVRALRVGWQKLLTAAGVGDASPPLVHAVCSPRTLGARDPWVNMLRVTTQVFAAVLGGADLVTPLAFDHALGVPSGLGRRVARNTGLVLREESFLGQVADPVGGSYYFDTLTDALARQAWSRFQALEREGGIADALTSGRLAARLEADWQRRLGQIATRRVPVLGVSEFANLGETRPTPARDPATDAVAG